MTHTQKVRLARRLLSKKERSKNTPIFSSRAWRERRFGIVIKRREIGLPSGIQKLKVLAKRFAWNALQLPKRAVCLVMGHATAQAPLSGFRDKFWCFRCSRIVDGIPKAAIV